MAASLHSLRWVPSLPLTPPARTGPGWYTRQLDARRPALVVLNFPGVMQGWQLPGDVLRTLGSAEGSRATLGRLAGGKEPGLYTYADALDQDPSYRLVAAGPYGLGYGSYAATPGTYAIWMRVTR